MINIFTILALVTAVPAFAVNTYVGIGTTSPATLLHLDDPSSTGVPNIRISNAGVIAAQIGDGNSGAGQTTGQVSLWNAGSATVYLSGSGNSYFNGGNLGIGTATPQLLLNVGATPNLDVSGTLPIITLHSTSDVKKEASIYNHSSGLYFDSTGAATATNNQIYFRTTNSSAANATGLFNAMVISSVGNITMPAQSSFEAKLCSAVINAPSTVVWETVLNNIGSNYSSGTGIYTAPVTGVYSFGFNTLLSFTGSGEYRIEFWKNGGLYDSTQDYRVFSEASRPQPV